METNINGGRPSDSESAVPSSQEGPNIADLPWEVLQEIFSYVDGKSLLICKRVCKRWRDHVHCLEQKANFWYDNCQKEIPSWTQLDLLDNMYPRHWKDQSCVNWEEIYKCWSIWNSLYKAPVTKSKRFSGLSGISSVKVSGEWLFISTREGRGTLCAKRFTESGDLIEFYVSGGAIIDFQLVISDKQPFCKMQPPTKLDKIFDTLEHNEIWLELEDCYVQLGRNYCRTLDKTQQRIRHSYGFEVRLIWNHSNSSIILKKICAKVNGPDLMELQLSSRYSHILDFWINTISLGTVKVHKELIVDAMSVSRRTQQALFTDSLSCCIDGELFDLYCWHGSLFIMYTDRRKITIHYDGKEEEQVTPIKKGQVMTVLFYANYFFVGTDRGKLLIYKIESPEDCLNLKVFSTPCWEIEVCQAKIIRLAIAEPIHHKRKRPMVICATPEDIYFVSILI